MGDVANLRFQAQTAYNEGCGQDDNPYPAGAIERAEWALQMAICQQEELKQLQRGFA